MCMCMCMCMCMYMRICLYVYISKTYIHVTHQKVFLHLRDSYSTKCSVTNGVEQGGVMLPMLFNQNMDQLSLALNRAGIEGFIVKLLILLSSIYITVRIYNC